MTKSRHALRPNRGSRLKELIAQGLSDEDELSDAWKENATSESDFVVASSSTNRSTGDSTDNDFSDTEESGQLSSVDLDAAEMDSAKKATAPRRRGAQGYGQTPEKKQQFAVRRRKASIISQEDRMAMALRYAEASQEDPLLTRKSAAAARRLPTRATPRVEQAVRFLSNYACIHTHQATHLLVVPHLNFL